MRHGIGLPTNFSYHHCGLNTGFNDRDIFDQYYFALPVLHNIVIIYIFASRIRLTIKSELFILFLLNKFQTDWTRVSKFRTAGYGWSLISNSIKDTLGYCTVYLRYPLVTVLIFSHSPWNCSNSKWGVYF